MAFFYIQNVPQRDSFMHWDPPQNSDIQLLVSITASARIDMNPRDESIYNIQIQLVFSL